MSFRAPALSVVGFERIASSAEQIEAVDSARSVLVDPLNLVTFVGPQCNLTKAELDFSPILAPVKEEESNHVHSAVEQNGHDEDEDHAHVSEAHEEGENHGDISAEYAFECSTASTLKILQFSPDKLPFGLDKIKVMWVSGGGQGAAEVTVKNNVVELQ